MLAATELQKGLADFRERRVIRKRAGGCMEGEKVAEVSCLEWGQSLVRADLIAFTSGESATLKLRCEFNFGLRLRFDSNNLLS